MVKIMKWPKISIVTPSYNQGRFLGETIKSVLDQNYPNLEYIVIDGGSIDNSVDIIKQYSDNLSFWVSECDQGQSDALNKGFKIATGDIIGWLNSDDVYVKDALFTMANAFIKFPQMDLIYGNYYNIDDESNIIKICYDLPYISWMWKLGGLFFCQPSSFFNRRIFTSIGYINVNINYSMDTEFFYRMLKYGCKFKHIPEFIAKFRYHSSSKTVAAEEKIKKEIYEHWVNYYGFNNSFFNKRFYNFCHFSFRAIRYLNNYIKITS